MKAVFIFLLLFCSSLIAKQKPLKVFILAGQSNMEGHAHLRVLDYMKENPQTQDLHKKLRLRMAATNSSRIHGYPI